jgi:predicted component of type VI protein secretion system
MQIVNGYICMNCCDIDKARLGQDPHQQANQIQKPLKDLFDSPASAKAGPAVTFGGSLQAKGSSDSAASASPSGKPPAASGPATSSRVDLLA